MSVSGRPLQPIQPSLWVRQGAYPTFSTPLKGRLQLSPQTLDYAKKAFQGLLQPITKIRKLRRITVLYHWPRLQILQEWKEK